MIKDTIIILKIPDKRRPWMRNLFSIFFFFIILSLPATCLAKERLLIITDAWPPYVFAENGVPTGFDYDVMMAVLTKMGYEADFRFLPWMRCIEMIKKKEVDGILDISMNESRKEFMHFPTEPLSESTSVLFHLKEKQYTFDSLADLEGLTIGTILGYKYNKEFLEADYFKREPVKTEKQNFQKLLYGRIDLLLVNRNVGLFTAQKMGILDRITYLPKPLSGGSIFLAFAKKPGHADLAEKFSDYLAEFKKTRAFRSILQRYGQL